MPSKNSERRKEISHNSYLRNKEKCLIRGALWAKDNQDARREHAEKYRNTHREILRSRSKWQGLKRYYGMTQAEYKLLVEQQGEQCAICGKQPLQNLSVNHNHDTGKVRGLLCSTCNFGIGHVETPGFIERAYEYLRNYADA